MSRLRAIVLGLQDEGLALCAAVAAHPYIQVVAIGERDRELAGCHAARLAAAAYDDCRLAVVESHADFVCLALPTYARLEYLRLAAERNLPVLTTGPPVLNLEQVVETTRFAARCAARICVARMWQREPAYVRFGALEFLTGRLFSAHVNVIGTMGDLLGWRGDMARAGGGVLFHDAYDPLDALVTIFGLPEDVYTILPRTAGPGEIRAHDTEDAATVMLRFPQARVATMNCRRLDTEPYFRYRFHGANATTVVTPEAMSIQAGGGHPPSVTRVKTRNRFAPAVAAFVAALTGQVPAIPSPIEEHVSTLAALQAIYLSARTGQPESPARLLSMVQSGGA